MTEWYVYSEDGIPKRICMGRADALGILTINAKLTEDEGRRLKAYRIGPTPALGVVFRIVGWDINDNINPKPNREIIRVIGPGTEV